jgi:hypothetical protein
MSNVGSATVAKFLNRSLVQMHVTGAIGFYIGLKICDYVFYKDSKYDLIREEMEDEYWKEHGAPQILKPYIVESCDPDKEGVTRESWITILYEKDKWVPKVDDTKEHYASD